MVMDRRTTGLQDFTPLWDAMDRFMTDSFSTLRSWPDWGAGQRRTLPLEMYETPDGFVVRAAAPGVGPDDLTVEFESGVLTIRAKANVPELQDGWKAYLAEFPYGESVRQLRLPRAVDVDGIQSTFEQGVLTLRLPKTSASRPKRIEISAPAQLGSGS